jgi:predicted Rossmann fold nucleotide-binding protein DprA/Smf involved in DNA uptake
MPGGLDRPFPPENRSLWEDFLSYPGAAFVSEFPFGTRASSLTLRKRNKLIVAFARAVLVSQSSADGGAMNAYRFAAERV